MLLVWEYGEKSEYEAWKGLSWGMVSAPIIKNSKISLLHLMLIVPPVIHPSIHRYHSSVEPFALVHGISSIIQSHWK